MVYSRSKYLLLLLSGALLFVLPACHREKKFTVNGSISGATDRTLYLEQQSLGRIVLLDSVKLKESGKFSMKQPAPKYPDFYRLRLGKQTIPFAVDSAQTITIYSDAQSFATSYTVEGSEESVRMKEIWLAQLDANVRTSRLLRDYNSGVMSIDEFTKQREQIILDYKERVKPYIFEDPKSAAAYFALFQQIDGELIFNLFDRTDSKAFAAVANVYDLYYPESERTRHLYSLTLRALAVIRAQEARQSNASRIADGSLDSLVQVISYIDINLPDASGQNIKLSEVADGHPTLLSFVSMAAEWTPQYTAFLRDVYNKYAPQGLKIYQVCLDQDQHAWRSGIQGLPWINVRDKDGSYSALVGHYNLVTLPTIFVIDKQGNLSKRFNSFEEVTVWLRKNL